MKYLMIIAVVWMLSGCSTTNEPLGDSFGAAVKAANNAQIVDPTPAQGAPAADPDVQNAAVKRYKTDTVKQPKSESFSVD